MALQSVERLEDLPEPVPESDFVVIDVITASTSIITLLEQGAAYVKPFADADAARAFAKETPDCVLVGEDNGGPLEGFDHVPLPVQLREADLAGRPVAIRTSNGTRAVDRIGDHEVFIGSTINASAVAEVLSHRENEVWLVGAGYGGVPAPEDTAGVKLIEAHYNGGPTAEQLQSLYDAIDDSSPALWIRQLGMADEIEAILAFDSTETVPRLEDGVFVAER